ncbi:uncharacterized protein YlxW (UPF0749 family) [Lapillicoccus jejuensis]|uniref:Uncharacterized protein YlxW (UPF0749 family) n=1 Tax=Lapillicoccus jejuensis TaxID=402171 RepID=A0A542DYZ7_9MICO|nr:uncharacterized protein YlxW (UPF0749 family) [Lapillicoccus jejuensis]
MAEPGGDNPQHDPGRPRRPRPSAWRVLVPLVAAGAGVLFATSFQTARGTELRSTGQDLPGLVRQASRQVEQRQEQVAAAQAEVDRLTAAAAPGSAQVRELTAAASAAAPQAAATAVHGPALTVTLDDAHRTADSLPAPYGPDDIVVHQQDVQGVVNALWRGGAEAMTIQGQRVAATTAVRCVGNTLILAGRVYSPPYVISAIGPVDALRASLDRDPAVMVYREWVAAVGLGYTVTDSQDATFPAYALTVPRSEASVGR